eukprot:GILK01008720.1.p1 GENE.GILK01008720.1~~GILK01008720.1.p1  ORF type:complete len:1068 (-),score=251.93 GILK01008720.1:106-3309(-)
MELLKQNMNMGTMLPVQSTELTHTTAATSASASSPKSALLGGLHCPPFTTPSPNSTDANTPVSGDKPSPPDVLKMKHDHEPNASPPTLKGLPIISEMEADVELCFRALKRKLTFPVGEEESDEEAGRRMDRDIPLLAAEQDIPTATTTPIATPTTTTTPTSTATTTSIPAQEQSEEQEQNIMPDLLENTDQIDKMEVQGEEDVNEDDRQSSMAANTASASVVSASASAVAASVASAVATSVVASVGAVSAPMTERQQLAFLLRQSSDSEAKAAPQAPATCGQQQTVRAARSKPGRPAVNVVREKLPRMVVRSNHFPKPKTYDSWSEAQQRAWDAVAVKPELYYFRYTAPSVIMARGEWSNEEKQVFLRALRKNFQTAVDLNNWSVISIEVRTRTGYQCRNFYFYLRETGQLDEDEFRESVTKKARMVRRRVQAVSSDAESSSESDPESPVKPKSSQPRVKTSERRTETAAAKAVCSKPRKKTIGSSVQVESIRQTGGKSVIDEAKSEPGSTTKMAAHSNKQQHKCAAMDVDQTGLRSVVETVIIGPATTVTPTATTDNKRSANSKSTERVRPAVTATAMVMGQSRTNLLSAQTTATTQTTTATAEAKQTLPSQETVKPSRNALPSTASLAGLTVPRKMKPTSTKTPVSAAASAVSLPLETVKTVSAKKFVFGQPGWAIVESTSPSSLSSSKPGSVHGSSSATLTDMLKEKVVDQEKNTVIDTPVTVTVNKTRTERQNDDNKENVPMDISPSTTQTKAKSAMNQQVNSVGTPETVIEALHIKQTTPLQTYSVSLSPTFRVPKKTKPTQPESVQESSVAENSIDPSSEPIEESVPIVRPSKKRQHVLSEDTLSDEVPMQLEVVEDTPKPVAKRPKTAKRSTLRSTGKSVASIMDVDRSDATDMIVELGDYTPAVISSVQYRYPHRLASELISLKHQISHEYTLIKRMFANEIEREMNQPEEGEATTRNACEYLYMESFGFPFKAKLDRAVKAKRVAMTSIARRFDRIRMELQQRHMLEAENLIALCRSCSVSDLNLISNQIGIALPSIEEDIMKYLGVEDSIVFTVPAV